MAVPSQMKAMVVQPDRTIKLSTVPGPKIEDPEQIIVKVHSCAQNPTDAKGIEMGRTRAGLIPGVDFSGIVAEVGSDVTNVKVGDKVSLVLSDLDGRLPLSALDLSWSLEPVRSRNIAVSQVAVPSRSLNRCRSMKPQRSVPPV